MKKKCAKIEVTKEETATAAYPLIVHSFTKSRSLLGIVGGSFFLSKNDIT